MKKLLCNHYATVALLTAAATIASASPASAAWQVLGNWTDVQQAKSLWCWAADDDAILAHFGYTAPTQTSIVNYVFGTTTAPNNPATDAQAQSALHHYGVSTNAYYAPLGFGDIQAQISGDDFINGNKPIYSHWNWSNSTTGHAVVIVGWSTENSTNQVRYMDPATGSQYWVSYQNFVADNKHSWVSGLKDTWAYK